MGKNIIIIDDSNSIRKMVEFTLGTRGYDVTTACDGEEGLGKLSEKKFSSLFLTSICLKSMDFSSLKPSRKRKIFKTSPSLSFPIKARMKIEKEP